MPNTPAAPAPKDESTETETSVAGKGRPTPSRAEREAARKRPLVPDTKEAKARQRAELAKREKARQGMAAGEEKYLPQRDKGPQRRFVRDFVDAGWHLAEFVMPAMILVIVATLMPVVEVQYYALLALWGFIIFVVGDMIYTSIRVKGAARAKFGEDRLEKGLGWYGAMRIVQMRFLRLPKPQVTRGQYPA